MNYWAILKGFLDRLSVRTKMIGLAIIAFVIGTFFGGHGSESNNGRYVPWGNSGTAMLDTRTGQLWTLDAGRIVSSGWRRCRIFDGLHSSAARMISNGAGRSNHRSNDSAPWWSNSVNPPAVRAPACRAAASSGVGWPSRR